ncbi:MAG: hypothetical protein QF464_17595, partial [Myxococcota bacterium]|nr:hypothetical protein [Myxococcota bacterium]
IVIPQKYEGIGEMDPEKLEAQLTAMIPDEHRFVYSFQSSGTLSNAKFTITANGDFDCDGVQSTYQRMGFGDQSASFGECTIKGSSAFYVDNEGE